MNLDGTGRTKVAENAYQPNWSGGGKSIAYLKGEYSRFNSSMTSNKGLVFYDLATGSTREHPEDRLEMLYNLTGSPDGDWFVATSRGGSRGNILFDARIPASRPCSIQGCRPDISPDGAIDRLGKNGSGVANRHLQSGGRREQRDRPDTRRGDAIGIRRSITSTGRRTAEYLAFSYGPSRGGQAVGQKAAGWNLCIYDIAAGKWVQITTDGNHNKEPDWVVVR